MDIVQQGLTGTERHLSIMTSDTFHFMSVTNYMFMFCNLIILSFQLPWQDTWTAEMDRVYVGGPSCQSHQAQCGHLQGLLQDLPGRECRLWLWPLNKDNLKLSIYFHVFLGRDTLESCLFFLLWWNKVYFFKLISLKCFYWVFRTLFGLRGKKLITIKRLWSCNSNTLQWSIQMWHFF